MAKKRVLSGIRASGRLHLGNYLGAVKGMLALQDDPKYETFYMVADLHSVTTPYDTERFKETVGEVVLDYLAVGLDPQKSTIFIQSHVPEHIELAYLFSTVVSVARMSHLPTYKEKVKQFPKNVSMALLNYPVLMAADILAYKADAVPVGDDQLPHLEVTREIARKMNEKYGLDFPEPEQFRTSGFYVPSLTGEGKMAKTVEGSFINLTDDLTTIKKRLAGAPTDSGKGKKVPEKGGVANLLKFVELFQGLNKRKDYEKRYTTTGIKYKDLKEELAKAIYKELQPIQKKRAVLEKDPSHVERVLEDGAERAGKVARETLDEIKRAMGLI
ncbi:tryptophan--tRNA ligase [Patescibacteria group bacterium]|nr:tryptophan--tRNA ligase [Patescibacteria group bacterium]